jgi:hypothetical protein
MTKLHLGLAVLLGGALFWACSTGGGEAPFMAGSGGTTSVVTANGGDGTTPGSGSTSIGPISTTSPTPDGGNFRRPKVCDATGQNCKCINLASFGAKASQAYGVGSDGQPSSTTAFETWLSQKSNATVTMVPTKPALLPEYLADFDVIILQDMRTWSLSADELKNLEDWVNGGGGLIALNGYMNDDDAEVTASNNILKFTGMSYNGGAQAGSVPNGQCPDTSKQLCPQATSACCYCWNNTIPITEWTANHPVPHPASTDAKTQLTAVGAYFGRSINAGDGSVAATYQSQTVAASKVIGGGKVLMWCDEWVTYTSQWAGGQTNGPTDQYQPCYVANASPPHWLTADQVFQTMQFWYNAIHYVSPPTECDFVINEPKVVLL